MVPPFLWSGVVVSFFMRVAVRRVPRETGRGSAPLPRSWGSSRAAVRRAAGVELRAVDSEPRAQHRFGTRVRDSPPGRWLG